MVLWNSSNMSANNAGVTEACIGKVSDFLFLKDLSLSLGPFL